MDFETLIQDDKGYIKVAADLDTERSGDALLRAYKRLAAAGIKKVVIDLAGVNIINSYGIGKLLLCQQRLQEDGGTLLVGQPQGFIKDVYEMFSLATRMPLDPAPIPANGAGPK